jgi:hypothetical protein
MTNPDELEAKWENLRKGPQELTDLQRHQFGHGSLSPLLRNVHTTSRASSGVERRTRCEGLWGPNPAITHRISSPPITPPLVGKNDASMMLTSLGPLPD